MNLCCNIVAEIVTVANVSRKIDNHDKCAIKLFHLWINYVVIYLMDKERCGSTDIYPSDKLPYSYQKVEQSALRNILFE